MRPGLTSSSYRTETAWQNLFKTEAKINVNSLQAGLNPSHQRRSIKGTLQIKALSPTELRKYSVWDPTTPDLRRPLPLASPAVAKQNLWLWYAFDYHLQTHFKQLGQNNTEAPRSHILGSDRKLIAQFYPFQRLFFLRAQREVDGAILSYLERAAVGKVTAKPKSGAIHKTDAGTSFISRPVPLRPLVHAVDADAARHTREPDVFNTNALITALLESSDEPPVTVEHSAGQSLVASTAPRNMAHASLWESALRNETVRVDGVEVHNVAFATVDNEGHLAQISAASVASSQPGVSITRIPTPYAIRNLAVIPPDSSNAPLLTAHGVPGGARFDNRVLQENPAQATPPGYVLTGDIQLFGILPAKLYSFQGTASDGGVHEIVTISDPLPLATLFPDITEGDFGALRFQDVQLRYDDGVALDSKAPGTWLEGDIVFEGALQLVADIMKSVFNQADPKLHVEFFIGMGRNWTTLQMPTDFAISGSLEGISVDFAGLVKFTTLGVTINFNTVIIPSPFAEKKIMSFGFFGSSLVTVPGSIVPLDMDFTMSIDESIVNLNLTLRDDDWQDAFGIEGLTVSQKPITISLTQANRAIAIDYRAGNELRLPLPSQDYRVRVGCYPHRRHKHHQLFRLL
jgi:hypothetical protein